MKGSTQPHLEQFFQQKLGMPAQPASKKREREGSLPWEGGDYVPYPRRSNAPELSLVCVKADGMLHGFQYAHLDSNSEFTPQCITLRFMGWEVKIHGPNLGQFFYDVHQHLMPWVREAARPHADDDESIVTKITITALKDVEAVT